MSGVWCWPSEPDPREPFADHGPVDQGFAAAIAAADAGLLPPEDVLREAQRLDLLGALAPEPPPPAPVEELPSEADLVRVATEHDPGVVGSAPDRVLGPWADEADLHTRMIAVAWGALFPGDGWDSSPVWRWLRSKPGPPSQIRPGVAAILRTPPSLLRITALSGDRIEVEDLLGIPGPAGPVRLGRPGTPIGGPEPGSWLMARRIATTRGVVAVTPIVVPSAPAAVARWRRWAPLAARAADPKVRTLGEVLRAQGHHLARRLLETAWLEGR